MRSWLLLSRGYVTGRYCAGPVLAECLPVQVDATAIHGTPDVMTLDRDTNALVMAICFEQVAAKIIKPCEEFGEKPLLFFPAPVPTDNVSIDFKVAAHKENSRASAGQGRFDAHDHSGLHSPGAFLIRFAIKENIQSIL